MSLTNKILSLLFTTKYELIEDIARLQRKYNLVKERVEKSFPPCPDCHGSGLDLDSKLDPKPPCLTCDGFGYISDIERLHIKIDKAERHLRILTGKTIKGDLPSDWAYTAPGSWIYNAKPNIFCSITMGVINDRHWILHIHRKNGSMTTTYDTLIDAFNAAHKQIGLPQVEI
jgi:hypothetical protein